MQRSLHFINHEVIGPSQNNRSCTAGAQASGEESKRRMRKGGGGEEEEEEKGESVERIDNFL